MYQPRRVLGDTTDATISPARPVGAMFDLPRRAFRHARSLLPGWRSGAALGVALAATAGSVVLATAAPTAMETLVAAPAARNAYQVTRSQERAALTDLAPGQSVAEPEPSLLVATRTLYTSDDVTVRTSADAKSAKLGTVAAYAKVTATPEVVRGFRKVTFEGGTGWISDDDLGAEPTLPTGTSMAPCDKSASIEAKIRPDTKFIFRSVCANFPRVHSYGGWRAGGLPFHRNGRAIDIMLTPHKDSAYGHRIADYLIAHAKLFNIDHVIFEQHIWTPSTPHWRKMADRGGITANHFDHVHVAVRA